MPQKRNPVRCAVVLSAAVRVPALVSTMLSAMVQEHERGLGGWQAEWETLPQVFLLASGALENLIVTADELEVDPARMRANLDITGGLVLTEAVSMALAERIGRQPAHELVERACRQAADNKRPLRDVLLEDDLVASHLTVQDLDRLLDPAHYLGAADSMIDSVLRRRKE